VRKLAKLLAASLLLGTAASAQTNDKPTDYDRALAAGYKAQFICSGLWNGRKTLKDIEADELTGIYSRIAKIVPSLTVKIDEAERQVLVKYSDEAPPRTATWNQNRMHIHAHRLYPDKTRRADKAARVFR